MVSSKLLDAGGLPAANRSMGRPDPHHDGPVGGCERGHDEALAAEDVDHGHVGEVVGAGGRRRFGRRWWWFGRRWWRFGRRRWRFGRRRWWFGRRWWWFGRRWWRFGRGCGWWSFGGGCLFAGPRRVLGRSRCRLGLGCGLLRSGLCGLGHQPLGLGYQLLSLPRGLACGLRGLRCGLGGRGCGLRGCGCRLLGLAVAVAGAGFGLFRSDLCGFGPQFLGLGQQLLSPLRGLGCGLRGLCRRLLGLEFSCRCRGFGRRWGGCRWRRGLCIRRRGIPRGCRRDGRRLGSGRGRGLRIDLRRIRTAAGCRHRRSEGRHNDGSQPEPPAREPGGAGGSDLVVAVHQCRDCTDTAPGFVRGGPQREAIDSSTLTVSISP